MSFFEDASLVLIPSGYKTSKVYSVKPTDGTGDLTFTRSLDTATRVGPDGLIEKVRTNLILQSETFDNASWNKSLDGQVTITANAAVAPNGSTTADKMIPSAIAGFHCVQQQVTLSAGEASVSVYAKAVENSFLQIFDALTTEFVNFNLTTGVVGSSSAYVGSIEDAGNGWYRCKATKVVPSGTFSARIAVVTTATAVRGESFTGNGTDGLLIWGAQLESEVATPYIPTTTAAVSVGPVANVPRLDYLNSSCPRLLLEPQRTNIMLQSENLNTSWTPIRAIATSNAAISPDGFASADKLIPDTETNTTHLFFQNKTSQAAGTYAYSAFFKKSEYEFGAVRIATDSDTKRFAAVVNLNTGTITATNSFGSPTGTSSKVEDYGNGWYRLIVTCAHTSGDILGVTTLSPTAVPTFTNSLPAFTGDNTSGVFTWGAQLEAGAYATSYIPTLGASVTRGADAATKTSIGSLFGSSYTLFGEYVNQGVASTRLLTVKIPSAGNYDNFITIFQSGTGLTATGNDASSVAQFSIASGSYSVGQTLKFALRCEANNVAFYINGVQIGTDNTATIPAVTALWVGNYVDIIGRSVVNQVLTFPTALSNSDLAALTA